MPKPVGCWVGAGAGTGAAGGVVVGGAAALTAAPPKHSATTVAPMSRLIIPPFPSSNTVRFVYSTRNGHRATPAASHARCVSAVLAAGNSPRMNESYSAYGFSVATLAQAQKPTNAVSGTLTSCVEKNPRSWS